eukprot:3992484-Pyramimonas_sp.AAC.1
MVGTAQAFISARFCARGLPRLGIGVMWQGKVGTRPSEMLGLVTSDLIRPGESGYVPGRGPLIVALATTNAKRPQSNSILESDNPVLVNTLRLFKAPTAPGGRLSPYILEQHRKNLVQVQKESQLQAGWNPPQYPSGARFRGQCARYFFRVASGDRQVERRQFASSLHRHGTGRP